MSADRLYWYRLKINRIIDADTFEVTIDKGHKDYADRRVRLYGVDAYEKNTLQGQSAILMLKGIFIPDKWYFARSHMDKTDSFGRYLYEIFLDDDCQQSLGAYLLHEGLAVPMVR
jgi:endonuclease YncB( thermonuclease family)